MQIDKNLTFIGKYKVSYVDNSYFSIDKNDRRRHLYTIGLTGTGKTTLLENIIIQDMLSGKGVCVIDPHGDMSKNLLNAVPKNRINDVVYINLIDTDYPVGINPLQASDNPFSRSLVASSLVSAFKNLWADSWGPRLEYILFNTLLALLEYPKDPGVSLLGVPKMLNDEKYRRRILKYVKDPKVKEFWVREFGAWDKRFINEAISPILNKVGAYLASPIIRNIIGQTKNSFDFKWLIETKKIVIVNLSKGLIGEDKANLMGSLIVSMFWQAALEGAGEDEKNRQDFSLVIDEFQNFTTETFSSVLSEARKYKLSLVLAHQYLDQLKDSVKSAVLGNVGTMVFFNISSGDIEELSREFKPFNPDVIQKFSIGDVLIRKRGTQPFLVDAFPPIDICSGQAEKVIKQSRMKYGRDRVVVEWKIERWLTS